MPEAVDVHWATEKTYEYLLNTHGRNSLDDNGMVLHSWVHYSTNYNNAFWNGSWMTYGDGDQADFNAFTSPDIVAHEMMHGLTDFSADLIYSYESGALNESFADIFGEVAENYMRGSNDWLMGADIILTPNKSSVRNMSNPNDPQALTQQPDTYLGDFWYSGIGDNGGVHINSGVQNHWFYLLCEGGSGTNDTGYNYDVSPIGMDKAAAIAYRNLTVYLTPNAQYEDARIGSIQAAIDLYGLGSDEEQQVAAAWCAVGLGNCAPLSGACQQQDYTALRAFYLSTGGDSWYFNDGWLTEAQFIANPVMPAGTDVSTWDGVKTNPNGCVIELDLSYLEMDGGNIPPEIGNLSHLEVLDLSGNIIYGTLIPEIGNLTNLRELRLAEIELMNTTIPPEIGNLTNLEVLNLSASGINGTIPPEIGNLTNLHTLVFSYNNLTGNIPSEIGNLTNLIVLRFDYNNLTGNIPPEIGNLTDLTHIWLQVNSLTGSIPAEFGNLINLFHPDISHNQLTGCFDEALTSLCYLTGGTIDPGNNFDVLWDDFCDTGAGTCNSNCLEEDYVALRALYLDSGGDSWYDNTGWLTEAEFIANPTMPAGTDVGMWYGVTTDTYGCVVELDLSYNEINSGIIPPEIGNLTSLQLLDLSSNNIYGTIPPEIGNLKDLTTLNLAEIQLNSTIPSEIGNLEKLATLNLLLSGVNGTIPPEIGNLEDLTTLALSYNNLSGSIPSEIGNLTNLSFLRFDYNNLSGNIPPEIGNLTNLSTLKLQHNNLTGSIPAEMGYLTNLTDLWLSHNQLSGCFEANLNSLCTFTGGTIDPGNNFDALWDDFCATEDGLCPLAPCREADYAALRAFYLSSYGDSWDFNEGWPTAAEFIANPTMPAGTDVSTWVGIGTDAYGCVTEFWLNYGAMSGTIAPEIGGLSKLKTLIIYGSDIGGNIPPEIGNLTNLEVLDISENSLTGAIPAEIGNLTKLRVLNLQYNNLTGTIPSEIGNLTNLTHIYLGRNELTGSIPPEIGNLPDLSWLLLYGNNLSGCYDASLLSLCLKLQLGINFYISDGNNFDAPWEDFCNLGAGACTNVCGESDYAALRALYLNTNGDLWSDRSGWMTEAQFIANPTIPTGTDFDTWFGVTTNADSCVTTVILPDNNLDGNIPAEMGGLSNLEILDLQNNQLTNSIPDEFGNLDNLIYLDLSLNQLNGSIPPEFESLSNLTDLKLSDNQLSSNIPPEIANLHTLEYLSLSNNQFSGNIPVEFGNLLALEVLSLSGNQLSGNIPSELGSIVNLQQLSLSDNQLTGNISLEIGNLTNLLELRLSHNQLEGCYDTNLTSLCPQLSPTSNNNQSISDGNNLDAGWEEFCSLGEGGCDDGFSIPVWPGDFNNDGAAGILDLLYWGVAEGFTGTTRPNATMDWSAQPASNWALSVNEVNSKHQDSNGDGTVDSNDLIALIENYGNTHNYIPEAYATGAVHYRLELIGSVPNGNTITNTYELYAESSSGILLSGHGLACSIDFNDLSVINASVDINNSYLIPDENLSIFNAAQNRLDIAFTRTDNNNQSLNGPVANIVIDMEDVQSGDPFEIRVGNGSMISANGNLTAIGNATFYGSLTAGATITSNLSINVSATRTGANTAQVSNLASGSYTVTVTDTNGLNTSVPIQINGQTPIYDANGNLLCGSTCPDYLTPSGIAPNGEYKASITLDSDAVVPTGDNVQFKAGQTIKLDKGFTIQPGASFSGEIEDCN